MDSIKKIISLSEKIKEIRNEYWLNDIVFTFNWWFLLALSVIPWILWWKVAEKKRLFEILFYGSIISVCSILLDDMGAYYILWIYQYQLLPISPRLNPIDLTVMPVTYMFVYQYFKNWKTFLIAQGILAGGAAFIAEPLFIWMDIYKPLNWKFIYSFCIYLVLGVVSKWFVEKIGTIKGRTLP